MCFLTALITFAYKNTAHCGGSFLYSLIKESCFNFKCEKRQKTNKDFIFLYDNKIDISDVPNKAVCTNTCVKIFILYCTYMHIFSAQFNKTPLKLYPLKMNAAVCWSAVLKHFLMWPALVLIMT